jgi:hypothetical protein
MTKREFEVVAKIIATLSFSMKDSCYIVGDSQAYDVLLLEELHDSINTLLKQQNKKYDESKFWNYVYNYRQRIINTINNA